jgi:hypothetical protein
LFYDLNSESNVTKLRRFSSAFLPLVIPAKAGIDAE